MIPVTSSSMPAPQPIRVLQPKLLVSVLSLGRLDNVLRLLEDTPGWLMECCEQAACTCHLVIRNNDPQTDFAPCAVRIAELAEALPLLQCTLVTGGHNTGFGGGHNANAALLPADYILILNDDLGFPDMRWLNTALRMLREDPQLACVGAQESPQRINPLFANGTLPDTFAAGLISYAEASVLLFSRRAFDLAGGFHADYQWAMCEDADLSLRVQQLGLRIAHIAIPHQHWRSTSFNALPGPVKSSILEHNRSAFFANWGDSFSAGVPGRMEIFDLWSDGMGDVFCALPHVLARLENLPPERLATVVVNTSHPELAALFGMPGLRVTREANLDRLRASYTLQGIATLRSTRAVNFSLPFNMHAQLPSALGIPAADEATFGRFAARLKALPMSFGLDLAPGGYCAFHTEFERDHEGRAMTISATAALLRQAAARFGRVALLGRERRIFPRELGLGADVVVDLQGRLSVLDMMSVVAKAGWFVGIDSFPSHVAAAAGVPAAVFFGAVHPLARSWNEAKLWPIQAELDCLGCYHRHLEPSVPFCMRRDQACTEGPKAGKLDALLADMDQGRRFDWAPMYARFTALQGEMLRLLRHHPAPPERLFRPSQAPNEQVSNLVYAITEQVSHLFRTQYQTAALSDVERQLSGVQSELFLARIALDEARAKLIMRGSAPDTHLATRIVQIGQLNLMAVDCQTRVAGQWLEISTSEDDPQLLLPPLHGRDARVQLRLTVTTTEPGHAQIFWAKGGEPFCDERVRVLATGAESATVALMFDLATTEELRFRIDPLTGPGHARLHGSLGGLFYLDGEDRALEPAAAHDAAPPIVADLQPEETTARGGRRVRVRK